MNLINVQKETKLSLLINFNYYLKTFNYFK